MTILALLLLLATVLAAAAGSVLALRAARWAGMVIAAGAGIRIGAAFFDLIPESIELLGDDTSAAMTAAAAGFVVFYAIEKLTSLHLGHESSSELDHGAPAHRHVGLLAASGMSLHSFFDGVALAAALAAGGRIGLVIAAVVVIHRFSDGIGIVSLLMAAQTRMQLAYRWVAGVAIAPLLGVLLASLLHIPAAGLGILLGLFAGFFLYIGAAELLPEAHRTQRSGWVVMATLAGVAAIWAVSNWAGAAGAH